MSTSHVLPLTKSHSRSDPRPLRSWSVDKDEYSILRPHGGAGRTSRRIPEKTGPPRRLLHGRSGTTNGPRQFAQASAFPAGLFGTFKVPAAGLSAPVCLSDYKVGHAAHGSGLDGEAPSPRRDRASPVVGGELLPRSDGLARPILLRA